MMICLSLAIFSFWGMWTTSCWKSCRVIIIITAIVIMAKLPWRWYITNKLLFLIVLALYLEGRLFNRRRSSLFLWTHEMIHFLFQKWVLLLEEIYLLHSQRIPLVHLINFLHNLLNLVFIEVFLYLWGCYFLFELWIFRFKLSYSCCVGWVFLYNVLETGWRVNRLSLD